MPFLLLNPCLCRKRWLFLNSSAASRSFCCACAASSAGSSLHPPSFQPRPGVSRDTGTRERDRLSPALLPQTMRAQPPLRAGAPFAKCRGCWLLPALSCVCLGTTFSGRELPSLPVAQGRPTSGTWPPWGHRGHWSGLPCPPPGDPPDPGMDPTSLMFPALSARVFTSSATWETQDRKYPLHEVF